MFEKKLKYLVATWRETGDAITAIEYMAKKGKLSPLKTDVPYDISIEGDVTWLENPKNFKKKTSGTFSTAYNYLKDRSIDFGSMLLDEDLRSLSEPPLQQAELDPDYEENLRKIGIDTSTLRPKRKPKFQLIGDKRMLRDGFEFSDDPSEFRTELHNVILLFASSDGKDEAVEYLAMRGLFNAGGILKEMEQKGYLRIDQSTVGGNARRKGSVTDEEVTQAVRDAAKELKAAGKKIKKLPVAERARNILKAKESAKKNPRKIFQEDHIRLKVIKGDLWEDIR